mmetsp:Transcript_5248/g.13819  ORF Transcript_5248/g.13819 Transcript_5248/m.13819 type:complete len:218 (+) Transcript_5248:490-1143(+)
MSRCPCPQHRHASRSHAVRVYCWPQAGRSTSFSCCTAECDGVSASSSPSQHAACRIPPVSATSATKRRHAREARHAATTAAAGTPTPTPTPKAMLKPTLKPKLMPTPAQASASPEAAAATVVRAARDADAVEEEAEQEEEYTPGEADFEEYTQSNPSRPRHLRLRSWVANRANAALGIHASPAVHGGMRSVVKDTERSALLQGVYLGSALVAAVAFL